MLARGMGFVLRHSAIAIAAAAGEFNSAVYFFSCALYSVLYSLAARETKAGTNVTMTTPPFCRSAVRMLSGTSRGLSTTARAEEWEKITGAFDTRSAAAMV